MIDISRFGDAAKVTEEFGQRTVDVPAARWVEAVAWARDELGLTYFDWLSAVDEQDAASDPGFDVVLCLWRVKIGDEPASRLLLRTRVAAGAPVLPTITPLFAGASWCERETYEMFGISFDGHPNLVPLLLPEGFEGTPLRKDFVLAARVARPWPGAKEPGESDADLAGGRPSRRRTVPPGVPDASWGPRPLED